MENRLVDKELKLVRYYPNYKTSLAWYQDLDVCKQVDNRDTVYDLDVLKRMYKYLDKKRGLILHQIQKQIMRRCMPATRW